MDAVDLGVNLFVALFALVDPIGNIPIFAAATAGASMRQRLSVSGLICIFIVVFLAFFFFTGLGLLQFFRHLAGSLPHRGRHTAAAAGPRHDARGLPEDVCRSRGDQGCPE